MFLLFCFLFPHIEQKDTGKEDKDEVKMVSTCLEWDLMKTEKMDENEILGEKPKIAITFDDGPHPRHTEQLLDGLKEREVKAAFFLIGENAAAYPEIVKREYEEGHLIGNHTFHHVDLEKIPEETAMKEIAMTNEAISSVTGEVPQFIRPPFGIRKKDLEEKLNEIPVLWNIDPLDWNTKNVDEIVNKVVTKAKDGAIILLHDCYQSSVEAAFQIIDHLQAEGFDFVLPDQFIFE
ncbi:MAG: polysaccharide deacetylase family protein [Lachnospiraceae bacterium]|nr:polysaccharide deacetylase family protein [Lachnospiraceae bacterium]